MKLLDFELDLVNLRSETYSDSRIPQMNIGTPKQDAERRDLTINSLFFNINSSEVSCLFGLLKDQLPTHSLLHRRARCSTRQVCPKLVS